MFEADRAIAVFWPPGVLHRIVEGLHAHPIVENAPRVDIGDAQFGLQLETNAFHHQVTQFVNHSLTVPGKIGRAFAKTSSRIGIGTDRAAGTCPAKQVPLIRFADGDVACRKVQDDRRSGQRSHGAGLDGTPEILANLYPEGETGQVLRAEDHVHAKGDFLPAHGDPQIAAVVATRKPSFLVKFAIVWQIGFRHGAQHFAMCDYKGTVVDAAIASQRRPDHQHGSKFRAGLSYLLDMLFHAVEQGGLDHKIVQRVGRKAHLGIEQQVHVLLVRHLRLFDNRLRIESDISGADFGCTGGNAHETVVVHVEERVRFGIHSRSSCSMRSSATSSAAIRTPWRPRFPKWLSRWVMPLPLREQAK